MGGYAARCGGAARNPGYHWGPVTSPSPVRTRVRTCHRRWAPRGVQALGGFMPQRLRSTCLTVDSTTPVLIRWPGRERAPSVGMTPPVSWRSVGHSATAFRRFRAVPWPLVAPAASRAIATDCATGKAVETCPGHTTHVRRSKARPPGSRRGSSRSSSLRWFGTPCAVGWRTGSRSVTCTPASRGSAGGFRERWRARPVSPPAPRTVLCWLSWWPCDWSPSKSRRWGCGSSVGATATPGRETGASASPPRVTARRLFPAMTSNHPGFGGARP
jgi:hypothetical protein